MIRAEQREAGRAGEGRAGQHCYHRQPYSFADAEIESCLIRGSADHKSCVKYYQSQSASPPGCVGRLTLARFESIGEGELRKCQGAQPKGC